MFLEDQGLRQSVASKIRRVLIADPDARKARLLAGLLRDDIGCEIYNARHAARALDLARTTNPDLIFVEHPSVGLDGYALVKKLRRSDFSCRTAPMIMVTAEATPSAIFQARQSGLNEFLKRPFTGRELQRRLEVVALRSRDWVEAIQYVGPDRRRFNSAEFSGASKRRDDRGLLSDQDRLDRALRIMEEAVKALRTDPLQAFRALLAQAVAIQSNVAAPPELARLAGDLIVRCNAGARLEEGDDALIGSVGQMLLVPGGRSQAA